MTSLLEILHPNQRRFVRSETMAAERLVPDGLRSRLLFSFNKCDFARLTDSADVIKTVHRHHPFKISPQLLLTLFWEAQRAGCRCAALSPVRHSHHLRLAEVRDISFTRAFFVQCFTLIKCAHMKHGTKRKSIFVVCHRLFLMEVQRTQNLVILMILSQPPVGEKISGTNFSRSAQRSALSKTFFFSCRTSDTSTSIVYCREEIILCDLFCLVHHIISS